MSTHDGRGGPGSNQHETKPPVAPRDPTGQSSWDVPTAQGDGWDDPLADPDARDAWEAAVAEHDLGIDSFRARELHDYGITPDDAVWLDDGGINLHSSDLYALGKWKTENSADLHPHTETWESAKQTLTPKQVIRVASNGTDLENLEDSFDTPKVPATALADHLDNLEPGRHDINVGGTDLVVFVDELDAPGDRGETTDSTKWAYEVFHADPDNIIGTGEEVVRYESSPHGGTYGNPHAKQHAVEQVTAAVRRTLARRAPTG